MKKILKSIGICIGLPLIVIAIMTVIQLIFMITFDDLEELKQFIFLPTFFAYVIFLPLYFSLSYVKGKGLLEQLDIKKIDKREIVYIVLFGSLVIPTVMSGNIVISIGTIIIAIVLFIFSIIKISEKYKEQLNKILYEE